MFGFDGVGEGVAEVEQGALAFFKRITLDYRSLVATALRDGMADGGLIERQQRVCIRLQPIDEAGVEDCAVFHYFGQACA